MEHPDVKPSNVHVLKDGHIKLLDFGIAREGDWGGTKTGQILGTILYMAPEQLNGDPVDGRSDVYSAGILLFELLTYAGKTQACLFSTVDCGHKLIHGFLRNQDWFWCASVVNSFCGLKTHMPEA